MTAAEIHEKLRQQFGDAITGFDAEALDPAIHVAPASLLSVARFLRQDSSLDFNVLMCLSSVDWGENLGVVYHLHSMRLNHKITIKVELSREKPEVDSVESLWRTADWHEREAYDMMGIVFRNHPDLRRILCPDDWEGYPLRKDYKVQEYYRGMYVPYPGTPPEQTNEGTDGPTG